MPVRIIVGDGEESKSIFNLKTKDVANEEKEN